MKFILCFMLLSVFSCLITGQTKNPEFTDFPVNTIYKRKNAPVKITAENRIFRTRLRWAGKNQSVNFAGRYILTFWGCGASCIMGAVIDAKTGLVYDWGFSILQIGADNPEKVLFETKSRLLIFNGIRNEADNDNGVHYYHFNGKKFIHLKTVLSKYQV